MAVHCLQSVDGQPQPPYVIEPHRPDQTDEELLAVKAQGAESHGWTVEWLAPDRFLARKIRWEDNDVTREFWIE